MTILAFEIKKINSSTTKTCTKCNLVKPLDQFHFSNKQKGRRNSKCISCVKEYDRLRNLNKKNKIDQDTKTSFDLSATSTQSNDESFFNIYNINSMLEKEPTSSLKNDFLKLLKHVTGSKTGYNIKEEIVANVLNLKHIKDVNGPDAYDINGAPWEIKTNCVSSDGNNKISAGGSFNDITENKLKDIPTYMMAIGIFIDHYLLAVATFPGNWPPFMERLYKEFNSQNSKDKRKCSSFHYNDWKDCPDMNWAVLPDIQSLILHKDKLTKKMFDDLADACTNAIESNKNQMTSKSKYVNILGL